MSAAPAPIPRPRVLHIDPDDRPGRLTVTVHCPVCWRQHTHDFHISERVFTRTPHCLRRLDAPLGEYVVDLTQPDGEAA